MMDTVGDKRPCEEDHPHARRMSRLVDKRVISRREAEPRMVAQMVHFKLTADTGSPKQRKLTGSRDQAATETPSKSCVL